MNLPCVEAEFIEQNKRSHSKNITKRDGGPYSKFERDKRKQEVYKLHFEYGYSARKISELMNINRNAINGDIDYWYSKIYNKHSIFDPEDAIINHLERLEIQRSRLREQLDKTKTFPEKMSLEKMMYDIDCKILHIYSRTAESARRLLDFSTEQVNQCLKDNKKEYRYLTLSDRMSVLEKTQEKINKIIKEDRKYYHF